MGCLSRIHRLCKRKASKHGQTEEQSSDLNEQISHSDPRVDQMSKFSPSELKFAHVEQARHIIGWCPDVRNIAGSVGANFNIEESGLPHPPASIQFGVKSPDPLVQPRSERSDLTARIESIATKFFILHDIDAMERRAWLVDGASTLLHLVLFSLHEDINGDLKDIHTFKLSDIHPPPDAYRGGKSAMQTLTNPLNLRLPVRPGCEKAPGGRGSMVVTTYRFQDRVREVLNFLLEVIANEDSKPAFEVKMSFSRFGHIEGFDFTDVASRNSPMYRKARELSHHSSAWAAFARDIHAISLFGNGFGSIIHPSPGTAKPCGLCVWDREAPKGHDILVATIEDLHKLRLKKVTNDHSTWILSNKFSWNRLGDSYLPCACSAKTSTNRLQTLRRRLSIESLRSSTSRRGPERNKERPEAMEPCHTGAVIFGSSVKGLKSGLGHNIFVADPSSSPEHGEDGKRTAWGQRMRTVSRKVSGIFSKET